MELIFNFYSNVINNFENKKKYYYFIKRKNILNISFTLFLLFFPIILIKI